MECRSQSWPRSPSQRCGNSANTGTYPESGDYPNDGSGSDHDSLGLFQMRPQSGWGSVAELMDPEYQAAAFFGGSSGPNYPSPRGLLDIPGWQSMGKGEVAQAVEVSRVPGSVQQLRTRCREDSRNTHERCLDVVDDCCVNHDSVSDIATTNRRSDEILPSRISIAGRVLGSHWRLRATHRSHNRRERLPYRHRSCRGRRDTHSRCSGWSGDRRRVLRRLGRADRHRTPHIDSTTVATAYAHMWQTGIHVTVGDRVIAGQHIGDVGSS